MLITILSSMLFTNKRKAMQLFPESVRTLWNVWQIRAMVLISLGLQSILILIGNQRKHSTSNLLRIVLWLSYLSADSVATVSLGILSNNQEDSEGDFVNPNFVITAFWAPFLLLHLGGPDTITAYSLADNELWLRHLLGLAVQVFVAFYVSIRAWSSRVMNFLAIPMFIVGIIKYGERTWVLRSASSEHFRNSMLHDPDPGPNYARYMEEYSSKRAEGFRVYTGAVIEATIVEDQSNSDAAANDNALVSSKANRFFDTFKRLCADLILSFDDIENSKSFFCNRCFQNAFEVIEFELGLLYDVFYTKAVLVSSGLGGILRFITLSLTVSVFAAFLFTDKQVYERVDVVITYILLLGAIVLEIYAIVILLCSDRMKLRLSEQQNVVVKLLYKATLAIPLINKKRWSNTVAQYNLIIFCLKARPQICNFITEVELLEKLRYTDLKTVSNELKELIFEQLKEKSKFAKDFDACKQLCAQKGDGVLEKEGCLDKLGWTINEVEFDQSILLWHIATDLCYHSDIGSGNFAPDSDPNFEAIASKLLSDYMLYLLVRCPFMLPNGIGQIRFRDTCAEAEEFFKEKRIMKSDTETACKKLLRVCTDVPPSEVKGDGSKSVLFEACRLAKALQSLESERLTPPLKKWEMVCRVWVEMLSHAATRCRWTDHAQQLRRGGELLTHVWLLMAHLGLTEQLQISKGHVRAKLIVE